MDISIPSMWGKYFGQFPFFSTIFGTGGVRGWERERELERHLNESDIAFLCPCMIP